MTVRQTRSVADPRALLERVQRHQLPERSVPLIETYDAVMGDRDRFLWKWAHHLFPEFTLSSAAPAHADEIRDAKLIGLIFVSILDDIAENHGDRATFEEAAKIPYDHQSPNPDRDGVDRDVLLFAADVWEQFAPTIRDAPRADEFAEVVRFDLTQVLNAIEYSYVANQNLEFVTTSELQTYEAHNMMLYGFADVDLLHSPTFDREELSSFRRVIERAQRMVRIGNWVTTWEREITEGDFTSGIVVHALENDVVSTDDLRAVRADGDETDAEEIAREIRAHDVEEVFFDQWSDELAAARTYESTIDSVDVGSYLDGIETVMDYHLASRGLK